MNYRVGIYPGTFDPIHKGHISFANVAADNCTLDTVYFLPERNPRGKIGVSPIDTRVEKIKKTIAPYPRLTVTVPATSPITVASEKAELSHMFADSQVVLLLGSDIVESLSSWVDIKEFLNEHELCIGLRNHATEQSIRHLISSLEQKLQTNIVYTIVSTEHKDISSSRLRISS